jgi:hypothetical protein
VNDNRPLVLDLFSGLGGFSEGFIANGFRAVGFDIEAHDYGQGGYPGQLVLRDVRSLCGAELVREYGVPAVIVASPPCQEFSYMAMPWSKAKEKMRKILADPAEQTRLTDLFNQCFRIQREVSAAAGGYVPLVVENVRGAQRWVGKARGNFGSFYLWGDVPALLPIPVRYTIGMGVKVGGVVNWHDYGKEDYKSVTFNDIRHLGTKHGGDCFSDPSWSGKQGGIKQHAPGPARRNGKGSPWFDGEIQRVGSRSPARKRASAEIAKIPFALSSWLAKCFYPQGCIGKEKRCVVT